MICLSVIVSLHIKIHVSSVFMNGQCCQYDVNIKNVMNLYFYNSCLIRAIRLKPLCFKWPGTLIGHT